MTPGGGSALVIASGAATPLGFSVPAIEAAVRAGILMFAETPWVSRRGEPVRASAVDGFDWDLTRAARMARLTEHAVAGLLESEEARSGPRAAAFLAVPDATLAPPVVHALGRHLGSGPERVLVFVQGRAGFFFALEAALDAMAAGKVSRALVGGVDSLCTGEEVAHLDHHGRLLGAAPMGGGLIPGEGAGFLLLSATDEGRGGKPAAGRVLAVALGREANCFLQDHPNRADGLTAALRQLRDLPGRGGRRTDVLYTCETGESFWAEELAMASLRVHEIMPEPFERLIAAEAFGDMGAAAGAVMLAVGLQALALREEAPQPPLLLLAGSGDEGYVGACLARTAGRAR